MKQKNSKSSLKGKRKSFEQELKTLLRNHRNTEDKLTMLDFALGELFAWAELRKVRDVFGFIEMYKARISAEAFRELFETEPPNKLRDKKGQISYIG